MILKAGKNTVEKRITVPFEFKAINEDGTFEGYASTFGNKDSQGDVVVKGAFKKTIGIRKGKWPVLWQHDYFTPIGANVAAEEDDKGLKVSGQLFLGMDSARNAYEWAKGAMAAGLSVGLSIGFRIVEKSIENGIRYLKEIALVEYSFVTFPANEEADLTGIKSEDILKAIDFTTALQNEMDEQALWDLRYTIEGARQDALCSVCDDDTLTLDQKISLITTILDQYGKAMVSWYSKYLVVAANEESADDIPVDDKAGASISANTKKVLADAMELHTKAYGMQREATTMHKRGTAMIAKLGTAAPKHDPPNPPDPGNLPADESIAREKAVKAAEDLELLTVLGSLASKMKV